MRQKFTAEEIEALCRVAGVRIGKKKVRPRDQRVFLYHEDVPIKDTLRNSTDQTMSQIPGAYDVQLKNAWQRYLDKLEGKI